MNIIVLSSVHPFLGHVKASYLALASLLKALGEAGHQVQWATLSPPNELDASTETYLEKFGVHYFGNFIKEEVIRRPQTAAHRFVTSGADVFILFWDSAFEYVLPYIQSVPTIGYLAKQPFGASMVKIKNRQHHNLTSKIKSWIAYEILKYREQGHLKRLRYLCQSSDLSLADAEYYTKKGIPCGYIPNTFPDIFGTSWKEKRKEKEVGRKRFGFLANIGQVFGTGNFFGMSFFAGHILPKLDDVLADINWEINICGQGDMDQDLKKKLDHPRVNLKGFVDDIDEELLANPILLNLNNAGPLVTGYTRVIYGFSSGSCLIAHKNLVLSMPEVKHNYNALLGGTAEEIIDLIREATHNRELRGKIGSNARLTYEKCYHPSIIAGQLLKLAENCLSNRK